MGERGAGWGRLSIPAKNKVQAVNARMFKEEFKTKIPPMGDGEGPHEPSNVISVQPVVPAGRPNAGGSQKTSKVSRKPSRNGADRILGKTVRLRDKEHRKFVSRQACLVCGRTPSDPHHLKFMQPRALGNRVSDEYTVPICRIHHRELHRHSDEAAWCGKVHVDPIPVALRLWQLPRHTTAL